jgi:hypothetical protein
MVLDSAERIEGYSLIGAIGIVLDVRACFRHELEGAEAGSGLGYFFVDGGRA